MSQDLGGWERVVPEERQKNGRFKERFKDRARDEQNMRFGPHHMRLRMETKQGGSARAPALNAGRAVLEGADF